MTTDLEPPASTASRPSDVVDAPVPEDPTIWPQWKRLGFRFLAVYFLFYTFPFPLDRIPWLGGYLGRGASWFWERVGLWTGEAVLGLKGEIFTGRTGSGDTTLNYLQLLAMLVLALLVAALWSAFDRRRRSYERAARFLIVVCAFYLGLVLLSYGFAKVIPTQFSPPSLNRLLQPYGSSSPMGLVWTFMGLAPAYTIFSGLMEVIPGFLLFFRRTRLLGACMAAGVMANVAMLNYAFDVPVKLFSTHLLVMAIALALVHAKRLTAFFLANRPVPAASNEPLFDRRWARVTAAGLALLLVGSSVWSSVSSGLHGYKTYGAGRARPGIWGIHDVEAFVADGEELPPLLTDESRWRALVVDRALPTDFGGGFSRPGFISVQRMDGSFRGHAVVLDEEEGTITFIPEGHQNLGTAQEAGVEITDILRYRRPEAGRLVLEGTLQGQQVEITLAERDLKEMLLISRGYHWINEIPFNR